MSRKILVLGATGRTGQAILTNALTRGWTVNALARRPEALEPRAGLTVFAGTPLETTDIESALQGCDAVICALNNNRKSDSFFAKPVSPPGFMTDSLANTIAVMRTHAVRRIAILSASGVGDSLREVPWLFQMLIRHTNLSHTYRDHDGVDALIRQSGLEWTLARPVMLRDKTSTAPILISYGGSPKPKMSITREAIARFLLDCLDDPGMVARAPTISQG